MKKTFCRRFVGVASALMMFTASAPTLLPGGGYVYAAGTDSFDLAELDDNGIPVLYISIDEKAEGYGTIEQMNESEDHSVECTGTVRLDVPDGYKGDYSSKALEDTDELALDHIRGRGHSTWTGSKKPYKLKLGKSTDLLGMGKNKHWVLLANEGDDTLLKNRITSYIGSELGLAYTPQMLPVDVVMNGDYLGSYYLSEQVRVGKSRVEIDEITQADNSEPDITGGYLLAMGRKNDPEGSDISYRHMITKGGNVFFGESPEFYTNYADDETGTDAQFEYMTDYLQKIEDAVMSDDFKDENGIALSEYLDYGSTAAYWWVNNFLKNYDAYSTTSTYLYKERNGKLFFGPLWDFDQSMTGSKTEGFDRANTLWLNRMRAYDPEYQQTLFETWDKLDSIITDIVKEGGVLDRYAKELYRSEQDNEKRWGIKESYAEMDMEFDYKKAVEELREWLTERQQWVRDNIDDELTKARFRVTYESDGEAVFVSEQDYMSDISTAVVPPLKEGYVFVEWLPENDTAEDIPAVLNEDITLTAHFIPETEAILADDIFFSFYDVWFDLSTDGDHFSPNTVVLPADTQERVYEWSSSDTSVADVDYKGNISINKVGDTVINVKLRNGVQKQFTLHVYDSQTTPAEQPTELICESDTITLGVGEYGQVIVTPYPQPNRDDYLLYSTDDTDVIELIDYGVFRAVAPGEATVTVTDLDGIKTTCRIIVTEKAADNESCTPDESTHDDDETIDTKTDDSSQSDVESDDSESSGADSQSNNASPKANTAGTSNPKTGTSAGLGAAAGITAATFAIKKKNR